MKDKMNSHKNCSTDSRTSLVAGHDVLCLAEQRRLVCGSYCHQYGVLIRLALFAGLRVPELLGLQWYDLDMNNCGLCVQHQYLSCSNGSGLHITQTTPRFVPIPASLFKELAELHEAQRNTLSMYNLTAHSNSVAATLKGYQMPDWMLEYFFKQILQFCGLPDYSLGILRDTFAVNSIMQGMDVETLSGIMGESNIKNNYAQYIHDRTTVDVEHYNAKPNEQTANDSEIAYPVVVKNLANGLIQLYAPNFPELTCAGPVLAHGLIIMREKIEDELRNGGYCPTPLPVTDIPLQPDECMVQIFVNP